MCARFGISRKTGYKWLKRWSDKGDDGLVDQSHLPIRFPAFAGRPGKRSC
ncbi:MAG TPA: hypothetical protein EYQ63_25825 [Fuerstia sp.]|nr:hypothetical protein [Fuerstiella sp.]